MSIYLDEIFLENTGPISNCHIKFPFGPDGSPKPVVLVGSNGAGKTIFLSYVVDALVESAKEAFSDVVSGDAINKPYLRVISGGNIKSGSSFSLALLNYKIAGTQCNYCEKTGELDTSTYRPELKPLFTQAWNWPKSGNYKKVNAAKNLITDNFRSNTVVFFPSSRRESPEWLNLDSFKPQFNVGRLGHTDGVLNKPIWVESSAVENLRWVLDVYLDSCVDLDKIFLLQSPDDKVNKQEVQADINNRRLLSIARKNLESILREILQDEKAEIVLNLRQFSNSRLSIKRGDGSVIPSFQSLSAGQTLLFNLFATIIRYADQGDINKSFQLQQITGVVIIDEIDAHLHATLQHDIVPRLIRLFPKVQFILSTHAPLFVLGMQKLFGEDGFTVHELPSGDKISTERFQEFGTSLERYKETKKFEELVRQKLIGAKKPIVLTEGPLDPRYITKALELLGETALLTALDIEFVGIQDPITGECKHGGDSHLNNFRNICESKPAFAYRPTLLLYDCDTKKPSEELGKLWVRAIPKNSKATRIKVGIENLLPDELFIDRFYSAKTRTGSYGETSQIGEFQKTAFCDYVCNERKDPKDFVNFAPVVEILKQFLTAHPAS